MAQASTRRPLPALAFLLGLTLLTALVWWRVIHRADAGSSKAQSTPHCVTAAPSMLPQPGSVTVNVLNGTASAATPRNGLAGSVSTALRGVGFQIATVGNDNSGAIAGVAEIRYVPSGAAAARLVSFYLPGAKLVQTSRTDLTASIVEVSVGAKFARVATAAQAKAAMTAAHVSQAPARPGNLALGPSGKTSAKSSASRSSAAHSTPTC